MVKKIVKRYLSIVLFYVLALMFLVNICVGEAKGEYEVDKENAYEDVLNEENVSAYEDVLSEGNVSEVINTDISLESKSAILMEGTTGKVIYSKDADRKLNPASITKIMTLLLIYEAIDDGKIKETDKVSVSEHAASMGGSQVFLEVNETQTVETMIKCITIASANDAAVAMAEYVAGSEEAFVGRMNKRAKELGMKNTHFVNCCGLDVEGHMSTAKDVALMSKELITKFPQIIKYTTTWMDTITHVTRKGETEFGLTNTNKLVRTFDGITGLKTGSTSLAKYCLSATANRDGIDMIAVVMSAPEHRLRFSEAAKLLEYGFSKCIKYEHKYDNDKLKNIKVSKGVKDKVKGTVLDSFKYVHINEKGKITYKKVVNNVVAPVSIGDKLGIIEYYKGDKKIGERDIVAKEEIKKADYMDSVSKLLKRLINY